jgi:hypothetical protein
VKEASKASQPDIGNIAMAVVFLALIFFIAAAGLILPDREFSPQENRYLTRLPALSWRAVRSASYMSAVEEYLTDQFPGRDRWVSSKAAFQKVTGQTENNDVYFAADGYLIGKPQRSPADIAERNLETVLSLKAAGYDVALLVSPMAAEILREKLPALAYMSEQADLLDKLRRDAPDIFVDVEPALREASALGKQVFFCTDHHWTMPGAYLAYQVYMSHLGEVPLPPEHFTETVVSTEFFGTLWSKNSLPWTEPDEIRVLVQTMVAQKPLDNIEPGSAALSNSAPGSDAPSNVVLSNAEPGRNVPSNAAPSSVSLNNAEPGSSSANGSAAPSSITPQVPIAYEIVYTDGSDTWTASSMFQSVYLEQKDKYAYFLGQNRPLVVIRRLDADPSGSAEMYGNSSTSSNGSTASNGGISSDSDISGTSGLSSSGDISGNSSLSSSGDISSNGSLSGDAPAATARKLLIFKDSYAHCFAPFLLPHFDEIHLIDLRYWRQNPISYMEEHGIRQVLFLYNADDFSGDRSISQIRAFLSTNG